MQTSVVRESTDEPHITAHPSSHNHAPDINKVVRSTTLSNMRNKLQTAPTESLHTTYKSVIAETAVGTEEATKAMIPGYRSVRSILQRERSVSLPKLPKTKDDVVLEGEWAQTLDGEPFVLPHVNNDMVIFTTDKSLEVLTKCSTVYVDGTFKSCPKLYTQLYTIHGLFNGYVIPLVYALLSDKTRHTYYNMFGSIRDGLARLGHCFSPAFIMSDFESGLIEAARLQFPNARHLGCHFHFGQALWRKVQECGLVVDYTTDGEIRSFVEKCVALAFIPETEVTRTFNMLVQSLSARALEKLNVFVPYFQNTWLNGTFSLPLWNKYGLDNQHRTNNAMESWHGQLNKMLPSHPNIFVFLSAIQKQHTCASVKIAKANAGESPPISRRKYVMLEKKLASAYQKHRQGGIDTQQLLSKVQYSVNTCKR